MSDRPSAGGRIRHPEDFAGAVDRPGLRGADGSLPVWSLGDLFAGLDDPALDRELAVCSEDATGFEAECRGRVAALPAADLAAAIGRYEAIEERLGRIGAFAQLAFSGDSGDAEISRFYQTTMERITAIGTHLLFFALEINRIEDAAFERLAADEALAHYRPFLTDLRIFRPHQLSDEIEALLHEKEVTGHAAWSRLFDETLATLRIPVAGEDLTLSAALNRLSDPERAVREAAAHAIGAVLARNGRLFGQIINTIAKDKEIVDRWRHYPRPEAARNLANRVEDEVVDALVGSVTEAYPRLAHRYYAMKARWLGLDRLQYWDRNAPLPGDADRRISWSEARGRVLGAYRGFSPQMAEIAQRFFDRGWIDAPPRAGKASGAFAHPTVPSAHPYVLLNYHGRVRDVMTLAHELGHGVHQVLAADQGYLMSATPLTLAETASVFGEMLTFRALLDAEADPQTRRLMLAQKVEDMLNTVVRQIAFYRFEQALHDKRRGGEISLDEIGATWLGVQRESLGPAFEFAEEYRMFWAYVPHFIHTPFYVYAYAFGDCLTNALYGAYRDAESRGEGEAFATQYLDLLRAGGTRRYRELLEPFGLDPSDPRFWQRGLDVIAGFIDELDR